MQLAASSLFLAAVVGVDEVFSSVEYDKMQLMRLLQLQVQDVGDNDTFRRANSRTLSRFSVDISFMNFYTTASHTARIQRQRKLAPYGTDGRLRHFCQVQKSRDTETRTNIKNPARSNLDSALV